MSRDRAAYMRAYRAKRKGQEPIHMTPGMRAVADGFAIQQAHERIAELEEEVRHLKAELAKRPANGEVQRRPAILLDEDYATRPVRAVPKHR